jgi:ribosomal protein S18 acetylase RimI-like enzyme
MQGNLHPRVSGTGYPAASMSDSLLYSLALPDDEDLDELECGVSEVDAFFRERQWFKKGKNSPATYQFRTLDASAVIGYAAAAFGNRQHPDDPAKTKYLIIYAFGVHKHFQARQNNDIMPTESYATSMARVLEGMAVSNTDAKGLTLWVRSNNARAIAFYERFGFAADSTGAFQRGDGAPYLTMWKLVR